MPMLLVFTAIAASSNSIVVLILFRFLAGFGGAGALAVGAGKQSFSIIASIPSLKRCRNHCRSLACTLSGPRRSLLYLGSFSWPLPRVGTHFFVHTLSPLSSLAGRLLQLPARSHFPRPRKNMVLICSIVLSSAHTSLTNIMTTGDTPSGLS